MPDEPITANLSASNPISPRETLWRPRMALKNGRFVQSKSNLINSPGRPIDTILCQSEASKPRWLRKTENSQFVIRHVPGG
jgi:hypothetical protein